VCEDVAIEFRKLRPSARAAIIVQGDLGSCRNPSGVIIHRMNKAGIQHNLRKNLPASNGSNWGNYLQKNPGNLNWEWEYEEWLQDVAQGRAPPELAWQLSHQLDTLVEQGAVFAASALPDPTKTALPSAIPELCPFPVAGGGQFAELRPPTLISQHRQAPAQPGFNVPLGLAQLQSPLLNMPQMHSSGVMPQMQTPPEV